MFSINKFVQAISASILLTSTALAADSITIENAWSPEAPPVVKVMAGYMKINNLSDKDIKIKSVKSDLFKKVEIHLSKKKNGMMTMIKQDNLNIKANSHVELKVGGLHMMLMGKRKPVKSNSSIPIVITFDNNQTMKVNLKVKAAKSKQPEMKCGAMMKHH